MVDIVLTLHYAYEGLHEAWSREPEPIREEAISTGKAADDLVIEWATARERFVAAA